MQLISGFLQRALQTQASEEMPGRKYMLSQAVGRSRPSSFPRAGLGDTGVACQLHPRCLTRVQHREPKSTHPVIPEEQGHLGTGKPSFSGSVLHQETSRNRT